MTGRDMADDKLRDWLGSVAPRSVPDDLLDGVFDVTRRTRPMPTWRAWLTVPVMRTRSEVLVGSPTLRLAAILVVVALAVGALVLTAMLLVGGGIIRRDPVLLPAGVAGCRAELDAGQLLWFDTYEPAPPGAGDSEPTGGRRIRMYEDGLVLDGNDGRFEALIRAGDSGLTARRLTRTGVSMVLAEVERSGLVDGCHHRYAEMFERTLIVRHADGVAVSSAWGDDTRRLRVMSEEESAAAAELERRLLDLPGWLPDDAWVDAEAQPYDPGLWTMVIRAPDSGMDPAQALGGPVDLPDASAFRLSNGTPVLAAGAPVVLEGEFEPQGVSCRTIDRDEVTFLTAAFADGGAMAFNSHWWIEDEATGPRGIYLLPLLPGQERCDPRTAGVHSPRSPSPMPAPERQVRSACLVVPEGALREALRLPPATPLSIADQSTSLRDPSFKSCSVVANEGEPGALYLDVEVRRDRSGLEEVRLSVADLLGAASEERVGDRAVWLNRCVVEPPEAGRVCPPVMVVRYDDLLVVVAFVMSSPDLDLADVTRRLAERLESVAD